MHLKCKIACAFGEAFGEDVSLAVARRYNGVVRRLATIGVLASILLHLSAEDSAKLIRTYRNVDLWGISADGQLILAASRQKVYECPSHDPWCLAEVLAVYESDTGKLLGKLVTRGDGSFGPGGFVGGRVVSTIEKERDSDPVWVRWDVTTGKSSRTAIPKWKGSQLLCLADDGRILAELPGGEREAPKLSVLSMADAQIVEQRLQQPELPFWPNTYYLTQNCARWRSRDSYLLESTNNDQALYWISTAPGAPAGSCRTFPGEGIRNYVISQDSSLIAVATGREKRQFEAHPVPPDAPLFLTLLNPSDCSVLRRFELAFPEKKVFRFGREFPATMTISPDKTMLALAYGIMSGPSGYAYFGLYSLADGHRLATLGGDVDRKWPWSGFLNDEIFSQGAPIGALQFSPDSRMLYGTSQHLRQWDVSGLK